MLLSPKSPREDFCGRVHRHRRKSRFVILSTKERVAALPEDDFRRRAPAFQEPQLSKNLALADLMKGIGARHGRSAGEVAIAWTLRHPAVTAAIVGMRSAEQAAGVAGALEFQLSPEEIAEIDSAR